MIIELIHDHLYEFMDNSVSDFINLNLHPIFIEFYEFFINNFRKNQFNSQNFI